MKLQKKKEMRKVSIVRTQSIFSTILALWLFLLFLVGIFLYLVLATFEIPLQKYVSYDNLFSLFLIYGILTLFPLYKLVSLGSTEIKYYPAHLIFGKN